MWILTRTTGLTAGWQDVLAEKDLDRSLRSTSEWFNLDTGSSIVLVSNGGWQAARDNLDTPTKFMVFHKAATGQVVDLTYPMIGRTEGKGEFLRNGPTGVEATSGVKRECEQAIADRLQSTTNWDL